MISRIKKAVIEVLLVGESAERMNKEIQSDIFRELSKNLHVMPLAAKVKKVTVKRCQNSLHL